MIEKEKEIEVIEKLGFSKCRVSLAVGKDITDESLNYFQGKRIATSYPNTVKSFFKKNGIEADVHVISGSVEIAPSIGLAEGICDIVSSGSTLFKNGLKETQVILKSEAVLAKSKTLSYEKEEILSQLLFRIKSILSAQNTKYILMNVPNENIEKVSSILPVMKSPTILPLIEEGWSSLHSVIKEDEFWEVINQLKEAGAENILIVPIDKMVM